MTQPRHHTLASLRQIHFALGKRLSKLAETPPGPRGALPEQASVVRENEEPEERRPVLHTVHHALPLVQPKAQALEKSPRPFAEFHQSLA